MMVLNLSIGLLTFVSLALFAAWVLSGAGASADARVRALAAARQKRQGLGAVPFRQRVVLPFVESVGSRSSALLPAAFVRRIERRLVLAGQPMRPATFFTVMVTVGALFGGGFLLLVIAGSNGAPHPLALLLAPMITAVAMYGVSFWLSSQASARKQAMLRGLPDSMDLLTVCVEAGLGLDAAFHRVVQKQSGPLVDELRQMLREIGLGKARRDALLDLAERTDIEPIRNFANSVIQAEQLGTSLAQVLRIQAQRLRVQRRQRAEQEARRLPVKMVFPLVFCLMPALFIFIIGPIIVRLINYLSS